MSDDAAIATPETTGARLATRIGISVAIAVAATAIAAIPSIATGFALPWQPLSSVEVDGVTSLLPFSSGRLPLLLAETTLAGALAGLTVRGLRSRSLPASRPATIAALLLIQAVMLAQSTRALSHALPARGSAGAYLALVTGTAVVGITLGAIAFTLITSRPRPGATIALAWAAVLTGPWISALSFAAGGTGPFLGGTVSELIWWAPAVLGASAIIWCGVSSVGRALASATSLAIISIGPAGLSVIEYVAGSEMYIHVPAEGVSAGLQLFPLILKQDANLQRIAVTAVLSALGIAALAWRRRSASGPDPDTQR